MNKSLDERIKEYQQDSASWPDFCYHTKNLIDDIITDRERLNKVRDIAINAIKMGSKTLNSIKVELNASVYTVEGDEFDYCVYGTRDCLDMALDKIKELKGDK